jgi:Right handed beta helix region
MNRILMSWGAAAVLLITAAVPAEATVDHTYVSGKGTDTGGCVSPPTACRSFAYAIGQTAASGEIIVIDAANYSPVTITKSISIVADGGGPAGIVLPTGTAITINPGAFGVVVDLRGLTLDGEGTATSGIVVNYGAGSALTVTDCVVRNFQSAGIVLHGARNLVVKSVISSNGGFNCQPSPPSSYCAGLVLVGVEQEPGSATVRNSVVSDNAIGLAAEGEPVDNGGSNLTIANTMVTGSSLYGVLIGTAGVVYSYGDNEINGNTNQINGGPSNVFGGALTPLAKQ